jgi:hypothetical protein
MNPKSIPQLFGFFIPAEAGILYAKIFEHFDFIYDFLVPTFFYLRTSN